MHLNIYEIFDQFETQKTKENKKQVLLNYAGRDDLKQVLQLNFHPEIGFDIKNEPDWRPATNIPPGMSYESMIGALDRVYLFIAYHPRKPAGLTAEKQEKILIQILESMEVREAKIYIDVILKRLNVKGLTYDLVRDTFPNIL